MSKLGIAYKRLVDLAELAAIPADGDFYVVTDVDAANKEKKVSASRIQHIDSATGDMTVDGAVDVLGEVQNVSYESNTVYFEGNMVFNR